MPSIINATTTTGLVSSADNSGSLQLATNNGTTAVTIDTSQNVGIGTASPSRKLTVSNPSATSTTLLANILTRLESNGSGADCSLQFSDVVTNSAGISMNQGALVTTIAGGEVMRVNTSGTIKVISTIGVGNATPSASGAGITFPATQSASSDANTLDDYEEGTFTANVVCDSGSVTQAYNTGVYTKIGRLVTVAGYIEMTSVSSPSGKMRITLPFQAGSAVQFESTACFAFNNIVSGNIVDFAGVVNSSSTAFDIFTGAGATLTATSANQMKAGTSFRFSATYMTA